MDTIAIALLALGEAFALIAQPVVLVHLIAGVVLGLVVGVLPGLGGIVGMSLVLPFMFGTEPTNGLALMIGMLAVVPTSDTFASVLIGIPGSSASQATVLDGFPLAKQGEGARALSAAFASSLFGGLLGALFLSFFILIARPVVLAFGLPEILMITFLGLSMVAILAGRTALKGIAAAGLGLLAGTIGEADAGGSLRMASYDLPYLADGLRLVIVGLGIFAIPEIVALLRHDRTIAQTEILGGSWAEGVRDWSANLWLSVRCSLIGVMVGVIPGLGGSVVDWIAYGHTVQTAKDKSRFGTGDIRGVIGPESSNNAKEGGALVPTLIFGIPGSGSMAIFIGAVGLLGSGDIELGPQMISSDYLDVTYSIVWMLALANVVGTILCIAASGTIAKLTIIRFTLIAPFLFMLLSFAAFQSRQSLGDLVALFAVGFLGIMLRRFDWSRPAFLIGFVLSDPAENYSNQAYQVATAKFQSGFDIGLEYIASPIMMVLVLVTILSIVMGIRQSQALASVSEAPATGSKRAPIIFLAAVIAYLAVSLVNAALIPDRMMGDKLFPMLIAAISLLACVCLFIRMILRTETDAIFADTERAIQESGTRQSGLWSILGWFAALLVLSSLLGFILAIVMFLLAFFRIRAGLRWRMVLLYSACGVMFMCAMASLLNRDFPPGILQSVIDLPWPLGG